MGDHDIGIETAHQFDDASQVFGVGENLDVHQAGAAVPCAQIISGCLRFGLVDARNLFARIVAEPQSPLVIVMIPSSQASDLRWNSVPPMSISASSGWAIAASNRGARGVSGIIYPRC